MNSREIADKIFEHVAHNDLASANLLFQEALRDAREGKLEPRPGINYRRVAVIIAAFTVGLALWTVAA